jgi:hypothetical protein
LHVDVNLIDEVQKVPDLLDEVHSLIEDEGIRAFKEESGFRHYIVVSRDRVPRRTSDGIDILPWSVFLSQLWAGELTIN